MLRLTWRLMRRHRGRLVAAGLAIVISTLFSTAALVAVDTAMTAAQRQLSADYGTADLVVTGSVDLKGVTGPHGSGSGEDAYLTAGQAAALAKVAGVAAVGRGNAEKDLSVIGRSAGTTIRATDPADDREFGVTSLIQGTKPAGPHEIALDRTELANLGAKVGDTVSVEYQDGICTETDKKGNAVQNPSCTPPAAPSGTTLTVGSDGTATYTTRARITGVVIGDRAMATSAMFAPDNFDLFAPSGATLLGPSELFAVRNPQAADTDFGGIRYLVRLKPGADATRVARAIKARLEQVGADEAASGKEPTNSVPAPATSVNVRTPADQGAAARGWYFESSTIYDLIVMVLVAVALIMAGFVISNTFQVLIAQRTHQLALLRLVGATRAQVRRSVRWEAAILGTGGGVVGAVLGVALAELALIAVTRLVPGYQMPGFVTLKPLALIVPSVAGIVTSLAAAHAPAARATRVAPVDALRPVAGPAPRRGAGKARLVVSLVLTIGGAAVAAAGLIAAYALGRHDTRYWAVDSFHAAVTGICGIGVVGAAALMCGIMIGIVFWVPKLVARLTRLCRRAGPAARVAAMSVTRDPRRTAATAGAVIIGVTLMATVSAGAASLRIMASGNQNAYDADIVLQPGYNSWQPHAWLPEGDSADTNSWTLASLPTALPERLAAVEGIGAVLTERAGMAEYTLHTTAQPDGVAARAKAGTGSADADGAMPAGVTAVLVVDPATLAQVFPAAHSLVAALRAGQAVVDPGGFVRDTGSADPDAAAAKAVKVFTAHGWTKLTLRGDKGTATLPITTVPYTGKLAKDDSGVPADFQTDVIVPASAAAAVTSADLVTGVSASLAPDANSYHVISGLGRIIGAGTSSVTTGGPILEGNAAYGWANERMVRMVETGLMVLLAVALLIALIGVANTLSLSVTERRRETALLRALGLTRRQSARAVGIEGLFTALFGAVIGLVLGTAFGCGVIYLLEGTPYDPSDVGHGVAVAPGQMVAMLVIALVAGVVASVVPARANGRIDPALALASE
ncbi:MAG: ABC transporter permease [Bifidobacteriaceae bacterium]|jgi:putative ABC transport system permease protein|nr:ABC transporter permease [Bifidobacteriaceae bacterium]